MGLARCLCESAKEISRGYTRIKTGSEEEEEAFAAEGRRRTQIKRQCCVMWMGFREGAMSVKE
jgi:hypothetical protein